MADILECKQTLANIKGFSGWDISNYPLCEKEAKVIEEALEAVIDLAAKVEKISQMPDAGE